LNWTARRRRMRIGSYAAACSTPIRRR
jgi:hypothetical protein